MRCLIGVPRYIQRKAKFYFTELCQCHKAVTGTWKTSAGILIQCPFSALMGHQEHKWNDFINWGFQSARLYFVLWDEATEIRYLVNAIKSVQNRLKLGRAAEPWKIRHSAVCEMLHMSYFAYACKTEGKNGISRLISELLRTLDSSLRDRLFVLQNEVFWTT